MTNAKVVLGFKSVTDSLKSGHGNATWKVGKWQKHNGEIKICNAGFHASREPHHVLDYLQGNRLFKVEARGTILEQDDKFVASEMRLVKEVRDFKRLAVEYAVWNAKRALPNYKKYYPNDARVENAIVAVENWLKAKTEKQKSAAWSAVSAARSAVSAARSAVSAARSAAWSAAWSAVSAACAAESAAWSAACAARSAASAARSAARSAAVSASEKEFARLVKKHMED